MCDIHVHTDTQGLKMSGSAGSGAARKLLPANPHREFVTVSQEIFKGEISNDV